MSNAELKLNPFFRVRWSTLECDLLLEGTTIAFPDPNYLALIARLQHARAEAEAIAAARAALGVSEDTAQEIIRDLCAHRLLVPAQEEFPEMAAVNHWTERGWLDGLILHLRTRDLDYRDDRGADPTADNARHLGELTAREPVPSFFPAPRGPQTKLPPPGEFPGEEPLAEILLRRRSNQRYEVKRISQAVLATILGHANRETLRLREKAAREYLENPGVLLDSAFSALESYVFVYDVEGLEPGLYFYSVKDHALELVKPGLFRDQVQKLCIGQNRAGSGACSFLMVAVWERYMYRYRHARAYRNLMVNVAELAQKYIVVATAQRLSTFLTPNLLAPYAEELLGVPGDEEGALYVVTVG